MITYLLAGTNDDLEQILELQRVNLPDNISPDVKAAQGFVTVRHNLALLQQMNTSAAQVIARENDTLAGYALVMRPTLKDAVPVLIPMFQLLTTLSFDNKPLTDYKYYVMGQICVGEQFRGRGVFDGLYQKHREIYSPEYDLCITEISSSNTRSMRAHERVGFRTIHTFRDETDEWNIVAWDWS